MKKIIYISLILGASWGILFAQSRFVKTLGGSGFDEARSICATRDGGFIMGGRIGQFGGGSDILVAKYDAYGNLEWAKKIDGGNNADDSATCIIQSGDGGYVITGSAHIPGEQYSHPFLIKLDSFGNFLWGRCAPSSANEGIGRSVIETDDHGYILVGEARPLVESAGDAFIVKLTSNGNIQWGKRFSGRAENPYMGVCAVEGNSTYTLVGWYYDLENTGYTYILLIKMSGSGSVSWWKAIGMREQFMWSNSALGTPDDGCIIVGNNSGSDTTLHDPVILRIDSLGNVVWARAIKGTYNERGYSVIDLDNGLYAFAGYSNTFGNGDYQFLISEFNGQGNFQWVKILGGNSHEYGYSLSRMQDGGFILTGRTNSFGAGGWDVCVAKFDPSGNSCMGEQIYPLIDTLSLYIHSPVLVERTITLQSFTPSITSITPETTTVCESGIITYSDNGLAYNGNRHLVRESGTENLHIVYTDNINGISKILYSYSPGGGNKWRIPEVIGKGEFPAITLDSENNPCVAWTNVDTLFYARKTTSGWEKNSYLFPGIPSYTPSHPSISVTQIPESGIDSIHILFRLYNGNSNYIKEIAFNKESPSRTRQITVEYSSGANMITLDYPSITKDYQQMLHAVWQHGDTIYYGTRQPGQNWNVWGDVFYDPQNPAGHNSSHPFVETYGDSIFVVWQNNSDNEVYRGRRHKSDPYFPYWTNFSRTSATLSLYPVNASGLITLWADEYPGNFDIYWKYKATDPLNNLSGTPEKSIFCHSSLKRGLLSNLLYTIWQEGNSSPYEIKFKKITPPAPPGALGGTENINDIAYFTTIPANPEISPHLTHRDTFFNLQFPVDAGYNYVGYEFEPDTGYTYYFGTILYAQENLKEKITIDGEIMKEIELTANKPEIVLFEIPPELYSDEKIELKFEKIYGNYAIAGPVAIFRFEEKPVFSGKGGIESLKEKAFFNLAVPSVFREKINLDFALPFKSRVKVYVHDITGRTVFQKEFTERIHLNNLELRSGTYILRIENPETGKTLYHRFVKVD